MGVVATSTNQARYRYLIALGIVVWTWLVFSNLAVPALIESAYRGQSLPIFNEIIRGQATRPVSHYQEVWVAIARRISALLAIAGIVGLVIAGPALAAPRGRCLIDGCDTLSPAALTELLGRHRLRVIQAALALLIGGSLIDIVLDVEHWPFSPYRVYANVAAPGSLTVMRLFGVADGTGAEIPLISDVEIWPLDRSRLAAALRSLAARDDHDSLRRALLDCLARYERLRREGRHHGPPLDGVRLYEVSWGLDRWAADIDRPVKKRLIAAALRSTAQHE